MSDAIKLPWSLGDTGDHIISLQQQLNRHDHQLSCDGHFGPATFDAVREFQRHQGLISDGIVGRKTLTTLRGQIRLWLGDQDLQAAADQLGVELSAVRAVYAVESNGCGFLDDGRPVILYERHIMRRQLRSHGFSKEQVEILEQRSPALINKTPGGYRGGSTEHYRLGLAKLIREQAALESCSWGLFQIMGHHWQRLGYQGVDEFVRAMATNEANQLQAFVQFILTDEKLLTALRDKHWATFARTYNGPGYKKNAYHTRLAQHYDAHRATQEATA